ncbi:uncharacterized protein N7496_009287 [Penicillium cataractarum]|uniref:Uncharacterized protein n=1 Tax=Penicillium cataractarum TaxID=2100454 RepID=A0A9W9RRA6_9EURO|nr:uncharacterized protein N7496_009287 [Penicillium cataractarum]KAJ5363574.1 hypothetical protein N7496_009287 [Penicillium cataractarum]
MPSLGCPSPPESHSARPAAQTRLSLGSTLQEFIFAVYTEGNFSAPFKAPCSTSRPAGLAGTVRSAACVAQPGLPQSVIEGRTPFAL